VTIYGILILCLDKIINSVIQILDALIGMFCDVAISKETDGKQNIVDVLVEKCLWKSKKNFLI